MFGGKKAFVFFQDRVGLSCSRPAENTKFAIFLPSSSDRCRVMSFSWRFSSGRKYVVYAHVGRFVFSSVDCPFALVHARLSFRQSALSPRRPSSVVAIIPHLSGDDRRRRKNRWIDGWMDGWMEERKQERYRDSRPNAKERYRSCIQLQTL